MISPTFLQTGLLCLAADTQSPLDQIAQWETAALAAHVLIALCLVAQWAASAYTGRIIVPRPLLIIGLLAVAVALVHAVTARHWPLLIADITMLAAGIQVIFWQRRIGVRAAAQKERKLPVVSPERADPKSGVFPAPRSEHRGT